MNIITIHYQWKNLSFDSYSNQPLEKYKFFSFRSNHRRCSVRDGVLINFTKFTGKHLRLSLFFNKGLRPATLLTGVFQWIFEKFLRTPFLQDSSGRLLLSFCLCCIKICCWFLSFFISVQNLTTSIDFPSLWLLWMLKQNQRIYLNTIVYTVTFTSLKLHQSYFNK